MASDPHHCVGFLRSWDGFCERLEDTDCSASSVGRVRGWLYVQRDTKLRKDRTLKMEQYFRAQSTSLARGTDSLRLQRECPSSTWQHCSRPALVPLYAGFSISCGYLLTTIQFAYALSLISVGDGKYSRG
jgi:hypothetical protein